MVSSLQVIPFFLFMFTRKTVGAPAVIMLFILISLSVISPVKAQETDEPNTTVESAETGGMANLAVRTSKVSYQFGDKINVIVSVINVTDNRLTLKFPPGCQAYIEIDDIYNDEIYPRQCSETETAVTLEGWSAHEWTFEVMPASGEYPIIYPGGHEIKARLNSYEAIATSTFNIGYASTGIGQYCGGTQIAKCPDLLICKYDEEYIGANGYCIPSDSYIGPEIQSYFPVRETVLFSDLYRDHWAVSFIQDLVEKKVLQGYEDGTFKPDSPVTRAEIVKMALSSAKIPQAQGSIINCERPDLEYCTGMFNDLAEWQKPWVFKAQDMGIVKGYSETTYEPNRFVTRAEALKILLLAFDTGESALQDSVSNTASTFPDVDLSADWFAKYVTYASTKGLVRGYDDGTFGPHKNTTRAEASKLIFLLMQNAQT